MHTEDTVPVQITFDSNTPHYAGGDERVVSYHATGNILIGEGDDQRRALDIYAIRLNLKADAANAVIGTMIQVSRLAPEAFDEQGDALPTDEGSLTLIGGSLTLVTRISRTDADKLVTKKETTKHGH